MPPPRRIPRIRPDKLLLAAKDLIDHHVAQGRPRHSNLRRAVSTSYYVLFHDLSYRIVEHLLPAGDDAARLALTRSIDHGSMKLVCEWIKDPRQAPRHSRPLVMNLAQTPLLDVALSFLDLYQARQDADYDHFASFTKSAALQYWYSADRATAIVDQAVRPEHMQAFCALVALQIKKLQ